MKLPMPQRLAKIRNLHNLDDQYYYDDNDRLALSRMTHLERSDAVQKRYNMIKKKSEMIAMSHEIK
jgi:predicted alpha-1,6-mannanase (GH76 family)